MTDHDRRSQGPAGSLQGFHLVFLLTAAVLGATIGVWALLRFIAMGGATNLLLGLCGIITTVALSVYGVWFRRKMRSLSLLS